MTKDHIERTKHMIEVMQAYVNGEEIEVMVSESLGWGSVKEVHHWCCNVCYRIAKTPDTIDWSHVAPEFCFMKRNDNDSPFLYVCHPND